MLATGRHASNIGKADARIAMVTIYYTLMGVVGLGVSTYNIFVTQDNFTNLRDIFLCESTGILNCTDADMQSNETVLIFVAIANFMVTFSPVVAFLFSFNLKLVKEMLQKYKDKFSSWLVSTS